MSRIDVVFAAIRDERRTGLVTYVTAGDPDLERSAEILVALDQGGSDLLEVGVPFSDPLADGPAIQRASERALAGGTTLARTLELIGVVRARVRAPIVLFSYANPIFRMGLTPFAVRAAGAGVDGVLVLDWPPEEGDDLRSAVAAAGLDLIHLVSPTTSQERIRMMAERGTGFLYAISRLGVTGARTQLASGINALVSRIRAETTLPVAVGFGISRPEHVRDVGRAGDAAVVGSALVDFIAQASSAPDLAERVSQFVAWLRTGAAPAG
jgi:tryptophan synthase alpha chain